MKKKERFIGLSSDSAPSLALEVIKNTIELQREKVGHGIKRIHYQFKTCLIECSRT